MTDTAGPLAQYAERLRMADPYRTMGRVAEVIGLVVESTGPDAEVGELCLIGNDRRERVLAEVVGFRDGRTMLMPLGELTGIRPGDPVVGAGRSLRAPVGDAVLGRVLDGLGNPIDGGEPLDAGGRYVERRPLDASPPSPLLRRPIEQRLPLGVRALDVLVPCGRGQRLGIFAGSGVGKSTLLGMIARNTEADVTVIGLVGERGREVREFVDRDLGPEGLKRSVLCVATSGPARAGPRQVRRDGDDHRRGVPGRGHGRAAADRLGDAVRDGPARDRPRGRRAAGQPRLHAERVRGAAEAARAGRQRHPRIDHRP